MIIIKPKDNKNKFYQTNDNEDSGVKDTGFNGVFTLKNNSQKIIPENISIKKKGKDVKTTNKQLLQILKKQKVRITKEDETLINFLKQEKIKYKKVNICDYCEKSGMIRILPKKKIHTYNNNNICPSCIPGLIFHRINTNEDYVDMNKYKILLDKYNDMDKIIDIIEKEDNPLKNKEITLYDTLEATEEQSENISIHDLKIPNELKDILSKRITKLFPVQVEAINNGLFEDENLLIVSQTASGKTLIGELAGIPKAMKKKKMIYLSPLVALANQKYRDFKREYESLGLNVAIKVGKNRVKAEDELYIEEKPLDKADIIVATYEGLDYLLRSGKSGVLNELGVVIIDEIHMLEDEERGHRLNGLIHRLLTIFPKAQILGLSATINNAKKIAQTFNMKLVEYDKRPIKLERHIISVSSEDEKIEMIRDICSQEYENLSSKGFHGQCIIFTDSRRKTQEIAKVLNKMGVKAEYYHAGLTYSRKIEIEKAFINQEISAVITTSALAAGIDFPASTVIFESLRMGIEELTNNEFHQMLGRAGRPTYHDIGKTYIITVDNEHTHYDYEFDKGMNYLRSGVDNIGVAYNQYDVYEQVLADISAIENPNIDRLKKEYDKTTLPVTFNEAIELLLEKKMISYNSRNDTFFATEYGRAVSKSFINIVEADSIKNNLSMDLIELVTSLEVIHNVYLRMNHLEELSQHYYHIGTSLFSESIRGIIFSGDAFPYLSRNTQYNFINIDNDFMDCDCYGRPYCKCLEQNVSKHIIERRLQGWSPSKISNEFKREYGLLLYSGDVYSYLDQVIMVLESVKRISLCVGEIKIAKKSEELISKIEKGV